MTDTELARLLIDRLREMHRLVLVNFAEMETAKQASDAILQAGESDFGIFYGQLATKNPTGE